MRKTALLLAGATLALAVPLPAPAIADVADEAQFYFERGNNTYRQGNFDEALSAYYTSNRLVANRNVQFNIARCLEKLARFDEAFRAWSALLDRDSKADERKRIESSIEALRPHLALLRVQTTPAGALIYADRRDLGSLGPSPKRLSLKEGTATLILDLPGYRPATAQVEPVRGKEIEVSLTLEPIYGQLDLRRLPDTAEVRRDFVEGPVLRQGPGLVRLVPGRVVLFASAVGHATERLEVEVKPDETIPVDVPLSPHAAPTGALVVQANVDSALVRIDGREMGFTPSVIEGVRVGKRVVEVMRDGRETWRATIEIKVGERAYLDVNLKRADPEISAATKSLVGAQQAPGSVSVITADEIAAFGWITLAEALAGVRGAFSSNDRTYESVGFQGFSQPGDYTNRVLVLVDGHPVNDVLVGQGWVGRDFDVDLDNVQRIEIVRGPGSVLYGTAALFGVINVVTKESDRGVHGEASAKAGTLGMNSVRATSGIGGIDSNFRVSVAHASQTGDRSYAWGDGIGTTARMADKERATHVDVAARLGAFRLRAGINDRLKQIPTGSFSTRPIPGTSYADRRYFAELRGDIPLGRFTLSARAAYDQSNFKGTYQLDSLPPEVYQDTLTSRWLTGELRLQTPELLRQRITLGSEVQNQFDLDLGAPSIDTQRAAGADHELILSGYLVDELRVTDGARLNLGLRADHYAESFGSTVNPRIAFIVRPYQGGNTKLLAGRAFRAPSAYERFYNDGEETQKAAVELEPETILSAELEHSHQFGEELTLVGSAFANQVDNLIDLTTDEVDGLLVYRNLTTRVRGFGATGELRWDPGTGSLLALSYTGQRVRQEGESAQFINAPTQLAVVRSIWSLLPGVARLGNEILYDMGRRDRLGGRLDDAVIWNVTVSGEFRKLRLRYFAGIFNLLDVKDRRAGFPVGDEVAALTVTRYGRSARVGLAWRF